MTTLRLHLYGQGLWQNNCDDQYSLINIGNMEYWVKEDGTSCHTAQGASGYPEVLQV